MMVSMGSLGFNQLENFILYTILNFEFVVKKIIYNL